MKKTILVTHWDRNIDPEIFTIKGKTEKELIYDVYLKSEKLDYVLGENDEFLNEIIEDKTSKEELINKIPFETLRDFFSFLHENGEYRYREK